MKLYKVFLMIAITLTTIPGPLISQTSRNDTLFDEYAMNIGIFVVDYSSYYLESVNVSHFERCDNQCDIDSLPFIFYFDNWWDYAHVYFHYTYDSSLIFRAGVTWMGSGEIEYPQSFLPGPGFSYTTHAVPLPDDAEYYNTTIVPNHCSLEEYRERGRRAWESIDSLEIVNHFAEKPFRVGLYGYSRTEGIFPWSEVYAKWIIFIYRGNTETLGGTGTKENKSCFTIYPNPCTGICHYSSDQNPAEVEIFNMQGISVQKFIQPSEKKIDMTNLADGFYLIRMTFDTETRWQKILLQKK